MKGNVKVICVILLVFSLIITAACTKKETGDRLTLWIYDSGRIEVFNKLGLQFEAEYGIPVDVSMVDLPQIRTQLLLASGGTECADIIIIPHDNLGPFVENAAVMEVNLGDKKNSFHELSLEGFTYNGKLYGIPLAVENIGFFYNPELVSVPPQTWNEAITITENLKRQGKVEYMFGLPDATYNSYPVYDSFGGSIFGKNDDGSLNGKQILLAEPGFTGGLEFLAGAVRRGLVPETIDWDGAHVLFESGKAPFIMTGPWALNRFQTAGIPYAITKFPAATREGSLGNPFLGVQGLIISSASPRKLLAQSFAVDFIAREENMQAIFDAEKRPSAWKTIFDSLSDADTVGFNAAGIHAVPMPSIPEMGYVWDAWAAAANLAFSGERTPQQALQSAKSQIETLAQ